MGFLDGILFVSPFQGCVLQGGNHVTQGCASLALGYIVPALQAEFPGKASALHVEFPGKASALGLSYGALKARNNLAQGKRSAALGYRGFP